MTISTPAIGSAPAVLGAILTGGAGRRFGGPKATARLNGMEMANRVAGAMRKAGAVPVIVGRSRGVDRLGLPCRPDSAVGKGPLAGVRTAIEWALEWRLPGVLCVACDLPFLSSGALRLLIDAGLGGRTTAVAFERNDAGAPLCAWYSVDCLTRVDDHLARGDLALNRLLAEDEIERIPLDAVRRFGDPDVLFLNVNTPAEWERAAEIARTRETDARE